MKSCQNDKQQCLLHSRSVLKKTLSALGIICIVGGANISIAETFNSSQDHSPAQIDEVTEQWLNIERQTNQLTTDWKNQEPLLAQQISLLKAEKDQLKTLLSQHNAAGNDVDKRRKKLLTEQNTLEQKQASITKAINSLVYVTNNISPLLPPVLMSNWQASQVNASEPNNTRSDNQNNSEKLQQALAQLTKLAEFNSSISTHEGTVTNAEGELVLVQQLFLGAGTAWFVSRDGLQTGWGKASVNGWVWHFDENISSDDIKTAIAMFQKHKTADWVTLPIHLTEAVATGSTPNGIVNKGAL